MAFGRDLGNNPHDLKYYNFDFQGKIDFIYWFTSFYVFLNVAAFSVYIIVIRANILSLLFPKVNAKKISGMCFLTQFIQLEQLLSFWSWFWLLLGASRIKFKLSLILLEESSGLLFFSSFHACRCTKQEIWFIKKEIQETILKFYQSS